jgi:hypothetical protein
MNVAIFWDIAPYSSSAVANADFLLCWFPALKLEVIRSSEEVIRSSESSVHIRTTRNYIPEDGSIQEMFMLANIMPCSLLKVKRRFIGECHHSQDWTIRVVCYLHLRNASCQATTLLTLKTYMIQHLKYKCVDADLVKGNDINKNPFSNEYIPKYL